MANIIKRYRKLVALGCTHGELGNSDIKKQVLDFVQRYKPDIRVDLGDVIDTAAFRSGARGTPDEGRRPEPDEFAALKWLDEYAPNRILWGNHEWRLRELQGSPNAIVSYAANVLWTKLTDKARQLRALTKDYDYEHGAFMIGGTIFTHGYWFGEHAVRDHAEYYGAPIVMAHLHAAQQVSGRTKLSTKSFCTGTLADIDNMHYARRRRATSRWSHGLVFGEVSDRDAHLWLVSCPKGERLFFPL